MSRRDNISLWLASRLSLTPQGGGTSPGVAVAVIAVALSVCVMILSIAIVMGFKRQITAKVTGFEQQITVEADRSGFFSGEYVNEGIRLTPALDAAIRSALPSGATVNLTIRQPAILKTDSDFQGVVMKGITSGGADEAFLNPQVTAGGLFCADSLNTIAISLNTADALGLAPGDRIYTHYLVGENLLTRRPVVTTVYDTHFSEYDRLICYAPIAMLQTMLHTDSITATAIEINGLDDAEVDAAVDELRVALARYAGEHGEQLRYRVTGVHESGALYFSWLSLIDTNVVVILTLMACVAGFTLIASLLVIILQRIPTIGLLKAMGADDGMLRRTFVAIAARLAVVGILAGNAVALALLLVQQRWHVVHLNPDAYYLNYVPVHISVPAILGLDLAVAVLCLLLLTLPSRMIARLNPAATMRYE